MMNSFFLLSLICILGRFTYAFWQDNVNVPYIKSVLLFPDNGKVQAQLLPPIVPLVQTIPLVLHFDDLSDEYENYFVKIINCTHDWKTSGLPDMDFLKDYNEFPINQFAYSSNTYIKYIHYTFYVPKVKISGNFVLYVYKESEPTIPLITKRFIVYENLVDVNLTIFFSSNVEQRFTHQQVDAVVRYTNFNIINPGDIHFYIRQNYRWDNMKYLTPLFVLENQKELDYRYFRGENTFLGLNEYRQFDLRSLRYSGYGVENRKINTNVPEVKLQLDKTRFHLPYESYPDLNGSFFIFKNETGNGFTDGDYVNVTFSLKNEFNEVKNVYLFGALTNWLILDSYKLNYNKELDEYRVTVLLKQGFYNYSYVTVEKNKLHEVEWEGSYSSTENVYEGIVYYRGFGSRYDRVLGYTQKSTGQNLRFNR